jgi:hypothetical protein
MPLTISDELIDVLNTAMYGNIDDEYVAGIIVPLDDCRQLLLKPEYINNLQQAVTDGIKFTDTCNSFVGIIGNYLLEDEFIKANVTENYYMPRALFEINNTEFMDDIDNTNIIIPPRQSSIIGIIQLHEFMEKLKNEGRLNEYIKITRARAYC